MEYPVILRAMIANVSLTILAQKVQDAGLSATLWESIGAGAWGLERGVTLEFATDEPSKVLTFLSTVLTIAREGSALIVENGRTAYLLNADDTLETLTGEKLTRRPV